MTSLLLKNEDEIKVRKLQMAKLSRLVIEDTFTSDQSWKTKTDRIELRDIQVKEARNTPFCPS